MVKSERHKEYMREYNKRYYQEHRDKATKWNREHPHEKRIADARFRRKSRDIKGPVVRCPRCGRDIVERKYRLSNHKNERGEWCL